MVGGICEKCKNFKVGRHYLRHKECSAIVCINKNLVASFCPDINHYESISFACIPANYSENGNNKKNKYFKINTYFQNNILTLV